MRRFVVGVLIVISAVSLILASTSLWTRRNVINTSVFVTNVETMVDLPEVEARINDRVTTTVMTNPDVQDAIDEAVAVLPARLQPFRPTVEDGVRSIISAGVARLLSNDPFRPLTEAAVTSAHNQLVNGEPVEFTLGQAKDLVPASARDGLAGQVLDLIPNDVGVTILTPSDAPQVYNAIDLLKSVWLWTGLLALATLAGALGMSRHRRRTLRAWSVTTLVLGLLVLMTLRIARGRLIVEARPDNRDAVGAIYDVLAGSLRSWTLWLVGFTVLVLVLTLVWGRLGVVAAVARGSRRAREQVQRRREQRLAARAAVADGTVDGAAPAVVEEESWAKRVAANTRAFAEGLGLSERIAVLAAFVRAHLGPARWTGVAVGAVVLLFWPAPTLRVLIWIAALVALYLGALEWLQNRAPVPAAVPASGTVTPGPPPMADAPSGLVVNGVPVAAGAPAPRPSVEGEDVVPAAGGTLVASRQGQPLETVPPPRGGAPEALTPELVSALNDRLGLLVRLGAARDSGVLTDEEFLAEKGRLLAL
jgi:hypothetical protein